MSRVRVARPERDRDASRTRSGSVEVVIAGWHPGEGDLDSHNLRVLIRDGGVPLGEAVRLVNLILAGETVTARLPFADPAAAVRALEQFGARAVAAKMAAQPPPPRPPV